MSPNIMRSIWYKRLLRYAVVPIGVLMLLYLAWAVLRGPRSADIVAVIVLLLFAAVMIDLRRTDAKADRGIADRIRKEFPAESQPEVTELYNRLKTKELEYLFQKVLDDAHGDLNQARKLTGLAESIGWTAFLETRW